MKKIILLLLFCSSVVLAQNSFTQEWESPAGRYYSHVEQWESSNNVPEIVLRDANYTMYVYDGSTKALKYSYLNSDSSGFSTFASIYNNNFPIDVNNDGVYEIIMYKSKYNPYRFSLKVISGINGSTLYQNNWTNYVGAAYLRDIDGDGYTEILVSLANEQESKLVILSTTSHAIGVQNNTQKAAEYELGQNYPNPFNPNTSIEYSISKEADVKISVYDVLGQEVKILVNEKQKSGSHKINFDGTGLASGTYFYQITVDGVPEAKKMVLVK